MTIKSSKNENFLQLIFFAQTWHQYNIKCLTVGRREYLQTRADLGNQKINKNGKEYHNTAQTSVQKSGVQKLSQHGMERESGSDYRQVEEEEVRRSFAGREGGILQSRLPTTQFDSSSTSKCTLDGFLEKYKARLVAR